MDTTIYIPALAKNQFPRVNLNERFNQDAGDNQINSRVSDFVDSMRRQQDENNHRRIVENDQVANQGNQRHASACRSMVSIPGLEEAQDRMERAILEAEKFKAAIERPPGNIVHNVTQIDKELANTNISDGVQDCFQPLINGNSKFHSLIREQETGSLPIGTGLSNDNFFHLTCHIDSNLKEKIERGDYVDLDKLVPRDRLGVFNSRNGFTGGKQIRMGAERREYFSHASKES